MCTPEALGQYATAMIFGPDSGMEIRPRQMTEQPAAGQGAAPPPAAPAAPAQTAQNRQPAQAPAMAASSSGGQRTATASGALTGPATVIPNLGRNTLGRASLLGQ